MDRRGGGRPKPNGELPAACPQTNASTPRVESAHGATPTTRLRAMRGTKPRSAPATNDRTAVVQTAGRRQNRCAVQRMIRGTKRRVVSRARMARAKTAPAQSQRRGRSSRSEEHTSELQSLTNLVCRLLLEKKKQ